MRVNIAAGVIWTWLQCDDLHKVVPYFVGDMIADVPGAKYTWKFKSGEWDGRVQVFSQADKDTIAFRTGMLPNVLEKLNPQSHLQIALTTPPVLLNGYTFPNLTPVQLRPYQAEAVKKAVYNQLPMFNRGWQRGIIHVATGGGKTEIAVAIFQANPYKTTFLVHRKDLLYQAKERFERYGVPVGVVGDGKMDVTKPVTIATMQTVWKRKDDPVIRGLFHDTEQVFFDEAHLMASNLDKGNLFVEIADLFANSLARWGLTATPFMRHKYDDLLLEGVTGNVLYQISNDDLIKMGYLSAPKVIMKKVPGEISATPPKFRKGHRDNKASGRYWREVEELGIKYNIVRNKIIVGEMIKGPHPCLVLCKTMDQAEMIATMYNNTTNDLFNVRILSGKNSAKERREEVERLRDGSRKVIITTTIFDEGVDIPELRKVILASGGKSQVKLLQRVGRGLRIAAGKQEVQIIDFQDTHHTMLAKHAKERYQVWKDEGFTIVVER